MRFSAALLALTALLHSADGQSAKFSASWISGSVDLVGMTEITEAGGTDGGVQATEFLATINPPGNNKELLVGVSGIVTIITETEIVAPASTSRALLAKGGKGGKNANPDPSPSPMGSADAYATIDLTVKYAIKGSSDVCSTGITAAPGLVTLASRKQTLSAAVDLYVVCNETAVLNKSNTSTFYVDMCKLTAADLEIDGFVSVALGLDSTAAHHFNFIIPNLPNDEFDVYACYSSSGSAAVDQGLDGSASTMLAIGSRMITIQQVRAVNGEFRSGDAAVDDAEGVRAEGDSEGAAAPAPGIISRSSSGGSLGLVVGLPLGVFGLSAIAALGVFWFMKRGSAKPDVRWDEELATREDNAPAYPIAGLPVEEDADPIDGIPLTTTPNA